MGDLELVLLDYLPDDALVIVCQLEPHQQFFRQSDRRGLLGSGLCFRE